MKVKIIMTQFVHTDAGSFKSVVQGLTGRDSSAASATTTPPAESLSAVKAMEMNSLGGQPCGSTFGYPSFEEMDRMFLELPSFDDMLRMCVD